MAEGRPVLDPFPDTPGLVPLDGGRPAHCRGGLTVAQTILRPTLDPGLRRSASDPTPRLCIPPVAARGLRSQVLLPEARQALQAARHLL